MAWSTREVAELAGTTLRAVRYYHEVGLLDAPERSANGYKRYGVTHLQRLLRIRRLLELGMSVRQIRDLGDLDDHPEEELRRLDSEALATIRELERVRAELGQLLESPRTVDLPPDLARVVTDQTTTASDRALLVVMSRVLSPDELATLTELVRDSPPDRGGA